MEHYLLKEAKINLIKSMQTKTENLLNPYRYHLSEETKKRLSWLYVLYYERQVGVTQTANKADILRQLLSEINL